MSTNNLNLGTVPLMKLKNKNGEEIFSLDKRNDTVIVSQLIPFIDIFDTLTLYDANSTSICEINMSEVFISALVNAIERNVNNYDIIKKVGSLSIFESKIEFRELSECFPYINFLEFNSIFKKSYVAPNGEASKQP